MFLTNHSACFFLYKKPGLRPGSKSFLIFGHILVLKVSYFNEKISVKTKPKFETLSVVIISVGGGLGAAVPPVGQKSISFGQSCLKEIKLFPKICVVQYSWTATSPGNR